jgi:hypothetical protein
MSFVVVTLATVAGLTVGAMVPYLIISFVKMSWDVTMWMPASRLVLFVVSTPIAIILGFLCALLSYALTYMAEPKDSK